MNKKDEIMILSSIELRQPELPFNSDSAAENMQVSPTCPKPIVSSRKFSCGKCGAKRIWLHNWAVRWGHCDGKMIADYQRGQSLEQVRSFYGC